MKSDMYRLSRNVGLYVSPLIATFLIAQEAFGIGLVEIISGEAKNHCVEFFNMTVYFSPLMLLTPFLASIPYAAVFCEDANSGYLQFALHRNVYLKAYTRTKYFAVWTSGFLVIYDHAFPRKAPTRNETRLVLPQ